MNLFDDLNKLASRRTFLARSSTGLGAVALGSLLNGKLFGAEKKLVAAKPASGLLKELHHPARAKRIIYLFQSGAPSHIDLFDHKPKLKDLTNTELPASIRMGQRITGMTSGQKQLLVVGSPFEFKKVGKCQADLSEILPH